MNAQELNICTAPPNQVRVVYVDPRDSFPTCEGDFVSKEAAENYISNRLYPQAISMRMHDDQGMVLPRTVDENVY